MESEVVEVGSGEGVNLDKDEDMEAWQDEYANEAKAWTYKSQIRRGRCQTSLLMKMRLVQQIAARGEHKASDTPGTDETTDVNTEDRCRTMNDKQDECKLDMMQPRVEQARQECGWLDSKMVENLTERLRRSLMR